MGVTPEEVRHVAELARLRLDASEAERMTVDLNGILQHMEALAEAERGDDAPENAATAGGDGEAPLRPDVPGPDPLAFGPEGNAPSWEGGFFTVPRLASHRAEPGDDEEVAP